MAFKPKSAAETKARDLGLALARLAEGEGTPASIGVTASGRPTRASRRRPSG